MSITQHPPIDQIGYNTGARRAFIDLDGVAADFGEARDASGHPSSVFKLLAGSYLNLKPIPGAIDGIRTLARWGFDVWIATKIPNDNPYAATEKLLWVKQHLPELYKSVIITPNKGTLGTKRDFLIDDRPHKAHIEEFAGTLLTFGPGNEFQDWKQVVNFMDKRCPDPDIAFDVDVEGYVLPVRSNDKGALFIKHFDIPHHMVKKISPVHNANEGITYHTRVPGDAFPLEAIDEYLDTLADE